MAQAHFSEQEYARSATTLARLRRFIGSHRGWLLWGVGLLVLLVLSVLAHGAAQFPGDATISALLQPLHRSLLAPIIEFPSNINQPVSGGVIALAILAVLAMLRLLRESLSVALGTFGADLINALINGLVARPRPHNVHVQTLSGLGAHSFPSGHVEHVTMLFGFLFYLTLLVRRAHPDRLAWLLPLQVICVYFIALIGVGRIIEGDHQPSDVLGGYLVAALLLPLAIQFYCWLRSVRQRQQLRKEARLASQ